MNVIDKIVGVFSPEAGLRRKRARALLERAYEGAVLHDWKPRRAGASANADHKADARMLRFRARALVQNVPYIRRGINALVSHSIGTGLTPETPSIELERLWDEWAPQADADGIFDLYGLQAAAYRAMETDGEVLIRRRTRRPGDGLRVPLQIQLLEIDWLDSDRQGTTGGGNVVVNGIEYDAIGRVRGYWLYDQHPGDTQRVGRGSSRFVPASEIIHLMNPERPGQGRGITRLASVIARTRDLMLYEDAELQRKNLETRMSVLVSGAEVADLANPADIPRGMNVGDTGGASTFPDANGTGDLGALASGGITQLPAGMNVHTVQPTAQPGYVETLRFNLHLIAAGMDVPYEFFTGDMTQVNYSSARIRQTDFRKSVEQMQWLVIIPKLCHPLWRWFLEAVELGGLMPRGAPRNVDWSTPRWDYVNPVQDVTAEIAQMGAGLLSASESIRRRGYKPQRVFEEQGRDLAAMRATGALDFMAVQSGRPIPSATPAAPSAEATGEDASPARAEHLLAQRHATLIEKLAAIAEPQDRADITALANAVRSLADRPVHLQVAAPSVTVAPAEVNIENRVEPTPVEVRVDGATIHVEPTPVEVRVEPAAVSVAAPNVTVTPEVTVHLPDRETTTEIERDASGAITRTVQIETTKE